MEQDEEIIIKAISKLFWKMKQSEIHIGDIGEIYSQLKKIIREINKELEKEK